MWGLAWPYWHAASMGKNGELKIRKIPGIDLLNYIASIIIGKLKNAATGQT